MGLSSSQARLLSLTSRQHDIEYKAQHLEAQKLQMANESTQVYQEYENALNTTKVQYKTVGADGSATFIDATYNNLISAGYTLTFTGDAKNLVTGNFISGVETISEENAINQGYTCIHNINELQNIQNNLNGKYILMNDIDASGTNFTPIGSSSNPFTGILNGNGHVITNLTINTSSSAGLIATANGGTIENIGLVNANITGGNATGGILGFGNATINNTYVTGTINGTGNSTGGIVGFCSGTISNSYFSGDVLGDNYVGGIIGLSTATITSCYSEGTVTASGDRAGGFVGQTNPNTNISNCYSTSTVTGHDQAGGFVGWNGGVGPISLTNCYALGSATSRDQAGGFAGNDQSASVLTNVYYNSSLNTKGYGAIKGDGTTRPGTTGTTTENLTNIIATSTTLPKANHTLTDEQKNSTTWLSNMINAGYILLSKTDSSSGKNYDVNIATDTNLQEVSDNTQLKKAEAKYEADMRKIDAKDKKFDTDLAALETERNAIKTEVETLKTVAKDNVDRTFKLFS